MSIISDLIYSNLLNNRAQQNNNQLNNSQLQNNGVDLASQQRNALFAQLQSNQETGADQPPQQNQQQRVIAPVAPVAGENYNQLTAQAESGSNPDIGFHYPDRRTSAYGTYGITAPAYQDIQQANPTFQNRPINTLTPAEQGQANTTLTQLNAQRLQSQGVEPTQQNLQLAHYLGPTGAARYLQNGSISPAAAQANGGPEAANAIAQQRLNMGQPSQPGMVERALNAVIPSAQAAPPPPGQQMVPPQGVPPQAQGGPVVPGQAPAPAQVPPPAVTQQPPGTQPSPYQSNSFWTDRVVQAGQDPRNLSNIAYDPAAPAWVRSFAETSLSTQINNRREQESAAQRVNSAFESGNIRPIAKELGTDTSDGSWVKYYLFSQMGLKAAAESEANKLGLGTKVMEAVGPEGERGLITYSANGTPLRGLTGDGKPITGAALVDWAGGGKRKQDDYVGGSVISDATGQIGRIVSRNGRTMIESGGRLYEPSNQWRNNTVGTDLNLARQRAGIDLQSRLSGMTSQARLNAFASTNEQLTRAGYPPLTLSEMGLTQAGELGSGGGGATGRTAAPTANTLEATQGAQKDIAKAGGTVVAASQDTQNTINKIDNKIIPILNTGDHNIGSTLSGFTGRGPIAQSIGQQFETNDAKNTKLVMESIDMLAVEGLKSLGANPSTVDLQFYTQNKPNASSDPAFVKEWIESRSAALKRKLGYAETQVGAGGGAGNAPPVPPADNKAAPGTATNPIKLKL